MIYQLGVLFLFGTCMSISAMPNECVCTLEYSPLCGTDGMTYPNKCAFECDRGEATLAYRGECREKRVSPPCVCSREARPVCGSDGHTYNNPCMLNCAKEVQEDLHLDHVGNCATVKREVQQLPPCACPKNIRRVCASNGVTYNNECLMRCAGAELTVVKGAPCDT